MKILYLCADRGIPIRGHKGAAVHVRAMVNAFARAGHEVTLLSPRLGAVDGPKLAARLIEVPLPPRSAEMMEMDEGMARDRQSQRYNEVLYGAVRELMARTDFDFIYERYSLWSDVGARLSHDCNLPLLLEVNAPLCQEAAQYRHLSDAGLAAQVEARQFEGANMIAVVSEALQGYVRGKISLDHQKVHLLPNAVDPQHFYPAVRGNMIHHRHGLQGRIVVGFVGRVRPWHDLDTLLRAVGQLHATDERYHLLLVGQMSNEVPAQLAKYGLTEASTLTGAVPHDEVPHYIAAMTVAVSSHLPHTEHEFYFSPLKLYEYLACGVPTVAADIGQPSRLIQHGTTGYLYQPGDANSLAVCIRALVENPSQARQMAWQGAVNVLEKHTWDKNAQRVIDWVRRGNPLRLPLRKGEETGRGNHKGLPLLDAKLRQWLYRATRPDLALPLLLRELPRFNDGVNAEPKQIEQINILKYKLGRRCVLGYQWQGLKNGQPVRGRLIGKVFRDKRGQRLHQLQQALYADGFGGEAPDRIHVPRSLGYVGKMQMQVQEYAPGETLDVLLRRGKITHLIPRAAEGLAKLHHTKAFSVSNLRKKGQIRPYLLADEVQLLKRLTDKVIALKPALLPEVLKQSHALVEWAKQLPPLPAMKPVHRDFYYSQLLFEGNRVTLIDFDLLALGDPAIDVANFAAHLTLIGLELLSNAQALNHETELFLEHYARFGAVDSTFWQRFAFYRAATYFRLFTLALSRPGWADYVETLYQLSSKGIEGVQDGKIINC